MNIHNLYFKGFLLIIILITSCNPNKTSKSKNEKLGNVSSKTDTVYVEKIIEKEKPEKKEFVPILGA